MKENKIEKNPVEIHLNNSQRFLLKEIVNEKLENLSNQINIINNTNETLEKNYFSRDYENTIMKRKFSSVGFSHVNSNNFDSNKNKRFNSNNYE
jgi:hypothetical protein